MVTNASMLAPFAGIHRADRLMPTLQNFRRMADRATFTVPSHDPDHEAYDHNRYWCGPVWLVMNYMAAIGFAEVGANDEADRIKTDSARLVDISGFQEAYSSQTGAPSGGGAFTWSAAIWLAWVNRSEAA